MTEAARSAASGAMAGPELPRVVGLDDPAAVDAALTGGKAAALARAARAGLPVLPGTVLTTASSREIDAGADIREHDAVAAAFDRAGGAPTRLVVRSSSVAEDQQHSSMAGQFESVLGVEGFDAFVDAVRTVLDSRARAGAAGEPIAVLVQPMVDASLGGVMFGVDPVSGRSDRRVVTAVEGAPAPLVAGDVEGARYVLDASGTVLETERRDGPLLGASLLADLTRLGERTAELFGGPQDVEWAVDEHGRLLLLQSRPVTTEVRGVPSGPIFGPGPVAETFPEPLSRLEAQLWVPPLREAVREALLLAGAATEVEVDGSEIVIVIDGIVAIDLELTREVVRKPPIWHRLNPVPSIRRLRSAWRVGRLRAALPGLAELLLDRVDADLESVPPLDQLTSRQLLALLGRGHEVLRSLHAHEVLMGLLVDSGENLMTGASVALRVLAEARRDGIDDAEIVQRSPVVLALTGPRIAPDVELPAGADAPDVALAGGSVSDAGVLREALRLRVRWMQELTGRVAWLLGARFADAGVIPDARLVRHLGLDDLHALVTRRAQVVPAVLTRVPDLAPRPLPACFQVSDLGRPIPVRRGAEIGGGTGAGGGVGSGAVTFDSHDPPIGSVLVTTTLAPGLGPLLPRLAAIVSETGSVLSHLAILAREAGVATVVGYPGATEVFAPGMRVTVNGDTGDVTVEPGAPVDQGGSS